LGVPQVDHGDRGAVRRLVVWFSVEIEEPLDVSDNRGEQPDEAELLAETESGGLFGFRVSVESERERDGDARLVEVGDVVDEGELGALVDGAERG